jgi:3-keto-disaccharide hydrolase
MILRSNMTRQDFLKLSAAAALAGASVSEAQQKANADLGFTDTPMLPNLPYHVHDPDRPHPKIVIPANTPFGAPSDATVLFGGKDLSKWNQRGRGADRGKMVDPQWKVGDGYFEVAPGTGDLLTREKFGDCQLHVEWSSPAEVRGNSQARGNSGVLLMSRYEIQVLDMWDNKTYADGQAGAIYGQWPPLANPARRPGEWNTYDILFEAPRFEGEKVVKPVIFTVIYNGVVVQNHKESMGPMVYRQVAHYTPHPPEEPLMLQDHHNPVRFRNVWIRRLGTYDQPEG